MIDSLAVRSFACYPLRWDVQRLQELRHIERMSGLATWTGAHGLPSWLCFDAVGEELALEIREEKASAKATLRNRGLL